MDILGDRKFVEVPGKDTFDLPPLLVNTVNIKHREVMRLAEKIVKHEGIVPSNLGDRTSKSRNMDLAINLPDKYREFVTQWQWGDSILEWIRQCETTFGTRLELRNLLQPDLWPHAGRSSFVTLLGDKEVLSEGVDLDQAVGLRLTFRQPPPISYFSDQFLFYLNSTIATSAYQTWSHIILAPISCFPAERFSFRVINM